MAISVPDKDGKIVIVGAGVFGLSTALFLKRRGYKNVLVLDRQPFDKNHYNPDDGCDGASADINKVFRATYGDRKIYQDMALKALPIWREWTAAVNGAAPGSLPDGLENGDLLLSECGFMRTGGGKEMSPFHKTSMEGIVQDKRRDRVYLLHDEGDLARAKEADAVPPSQGANLRIAHKMQRFAGMLDGDVHGFIDMDGGFTRADKACVYALHLCKEAGVEFLLGPQEGGFDALVTHGEGEGKKVVGVRTKDGKVHPADKVIVACGGWTASVVPEASHLLETTGGSVVYIDLPPERKDLWDAFGPEQFCPWSFQYDESTGIGGFPRTDDGRVKFGYRVKKYTNYATHPVTGTRLSVPRTKYSEDPIDNVPYQALDMIKSTIKDIFPELTEIGITGFRMCWYTDSIDNHFVADYVPGYNESLFVASGGSGHGFKFLPIMGQHFVNQLEHVEDEFTPFWHWRHPKAGEKANGLEEGEEGPRVLSRVKMATKDDWKF